MKTILVLAQNPELPSAIRSALEGHPYRIILRPDIEEAEPLLKHSALDACILDADQPQVQALWVIEKLRELAPQLPIFVFSTVRSPEWEETAYLRGVTQILLKPVRGRLLQTFLERVVPRESQGLMTSGRPRISRTATVPPFPKSHQQPLEQMERVTALLPHAYSVPRLFEHLLPALRQTLAVQRIVVFLRVPTSIEPNQNPLDENRRLRAVASLGVSEKVLENFELSLDSGAGSLFESPLNILRRNSDEVLNHPLALQEFDVLGVDTAIALSSSETLLGLICLSGRVNGEPLDESTLESVFFLSEKIALSIKQIWAHERVLANHGMMADILRELNSACVVVGRDLRILHANKSACGLFLAPADAQADLTFSDLPQALCNRIYQVLKTGNPVPSFKYRPPELSNRQFHVTIIPFQNKEMLLPASALLILEDQTQSEQLKRLEIEAANLRLVRTMADRLAHEIGNALVPISTHQQLLPTRHKDAEFRTSLESALASGVKRIARLVSQMVLLAQDRPMTVETIPVVILIEDAFREAQRQLPIQTATLKQSNESTSATVAGDQDALKHALAEVFMNALQANPAEAKVAVRTYEHVDEQSRKWLRIDIMDNGEGFVSETAQQATDAFFTTRSVGLGLGLTVARKVVEIHQGLLAISPSDSKRGGLVSVSLPLGVDR